MKNDWMEDIEMSSDERKELLCWCDFIGYNFYEKIYRMAKNYSKGKVSFAVLKAFACYNFGLSDILYSAIKFVEYGLRAKIMNNCDNIEITKQNYLYELNRIIGKNIKKLPCNLFYDNTLKNKCRLYDFLNKGSLFTIIECYLALPDDTIGNNNERNKLNSIREMRNTISHCGVIIEDKKLKEKIKYVLEYIPSETVKNNKIAAFNECTQKYGENLPNEIKITFPKIEVRYDDFRE